MRNIFLKFINSVAAMLLLAGWVGCRDKDNATMVASVHLDSLHIDSTYVLDSVPSGSGIVRWRDDSLLLVGDDANSIFALSSVSRLYREIPLWPAADSYRESKENKHDFESATWAKWDGRDYLLAFGSGSNKRGRDSLLVIDPTTPTEKRIISLRQFYRQLRARVGLDSLAWNIEGSAVVQDTLILMNRADNMILTMPLEGFMKHMLEGNAGFPEVKYARVNLPSLEGHEARLSGACALKGGALLFCASVEDTPDWTQDGPVLGSFIGVYSLKERRVVSVHGVRDKSGVMVNEKIESVEVVSLSDPIMRIVAVGDNDDGSSRLFFVSVARDPAVRN